MTIWLLGGVELSVSSLTYVCADSCSTISLNFQHWSRASKLSVAVQVRGTSGMWGYWVHGGWDWINRDVISHMQDELDQRRAVEEEHYKSRLDIATVLEVTVRCLLIFASALMPSHHTRWGKKAVSVARVCLGNATMFFLQSMVGFHFFNQGMPRMTCRFPRLRTISLSFSILSFNRMLAWAFHRMVPLVSAVPSTLLVMIGWGSFSKGNLRRQRKPTSMKFPVALPLMRAVVLTVSVPLDSWIGIHMVLSLGRAVIIWFTVWEEYVNSSSWAKNPQAPLRLHSQGHLHSKVSGSTVLLLCPYPESSGFEHKPQWWRLEQEWCWMEDWGL